MRHPNFERGLYRNKLKNRNFSEVEGVRFKSQKTGHCYTTRTVFCGLKMASSTMEKTDFSGCFGIFYTLMKIKEKVNNEKQNSCMSPSY